MHIYLSYTESDRKLASAVRESLKTAGYSVWNPDTIAAGANWLKAAGRALEKADAIVFFLSDKALKSSSIEREIDYALTTPKFKDRVFPVFVGAGHDVPWVLDFLPSVRARDEDDAGAVTALIRRKLRLHRTRRLFKDRKSAKARATKVARPIAR